MNILSLNIRGLGSGRFSSDMKSAWVQKLRNVNEVGFLMLQETQFKSIGNLDVNKFWGSGDFQFEWVGASGRSGGIISFWDPKRFVLHSVVKNRWFVAIKGSIRDSGKICMVINVYSPQTLGDKRLLWEELSRNIGSDDNYWIVGGDCNCVRESSERRNSKFNMTEANEFNEFLEGSGLYEFVLRDKIFVSWNFVNEWPNAVYRTLARDISDHFPLLLKVENRNFGVKPFQFFDSWLQREGFEEVVLGGLQDCMGRGPPDIVMLSKLKRLKMVISKWAQQMVAGEKEEEAGLRAEVENLDSILDDRDLNEVGK
ncbi:uncharacterized protein LOC110876248 [Helianthus annuus]|uniref:uncharacterized protein LOC110876248 n=1 Tax=Helianthus annuus TaxID=4232 RepID=UPI000B8F638F|nr:uncharacterized protein LOC110876248 [Helianthus annuus]